MARSPAPAPQLTLTQDEARLMTLRAQGFIGADGRRGGVPGMLRRLGAVQLDTISVLARSHELVAYARLGAIPRPQSSGPTGILRPPTPSSTGHMPRACCRWKSGPITRSGGARSPSAGSAGTRVTRRSAPAVLARIRAEGPLTTTELGGAKNGGPWWDWSDTKIAVEWLLDTGEVICARRTGWRRVYDLPERVLPPDLAEATPTDAECVIHLAGVAARALGVVTRADLADYQRLRYGGTGQRRDGAGGYRRLRPPRRPA